MNTGRGRATPDSEAVASSEDERPWPSSTSFGSLPRKENGMPGLPGGIWSTQKRAGSFTMAEAARRNAAREVQLAAANAHSGLRPGTTPSPATSDGTGTLPFAIPLQPTPKAGRSLSHSQGQREAASGNGTTPTAPVLPLGLLTEEADPDTDSEFGEQLTQTVSHPPIGTLQRASTFNSAYDHLHHTSNGRARPDDYPGASGGPSFDPRLEAAVANLSFAEQPPRRSQWQSSLGWDNVPSVNESRRHSLADIPTRRGSFAADDRSDFMGPALSRLARERAIHEQDRGPANALLSNAQSFGESAMRASDDDLGFSIPQQYKVPFVDIKDYERSDDDIRRERQHASLGGGPFWAGSVGRPRKQLFIVSFKCSRVDVFYLLDNTGLHIKEGDIVIVEADRGQDLGTVQHANITPDQARIYKRKYSEEQYKWLMMFSRNNTPSSVNPNAQLYGENSATGGSRGENKSFMANAPPTMQGLPRDNFNNLKPKAIKRLANKHEIKMLGEKEGNEAKAKRTCQQKVAHLHLEMEILDAEWQWDFQKLIFYYYADHYINFKDLITDLYRIYKTRIWLSAVNPASFSQHAMGQPPSGIGPGAITSYGQGLNTSYTMSYGQDPDPYGAVPPYRIGYETYTPNYPGIPGVSNSFAPGSASFTPSNFQSSAPDSTNAFPTMPPGATPSGSHLDYRQYYDGASSVHLTPTEATPAMTPTTPTSGGTFNPYAVQYYPGVFSGNAGSTSHTFSSPWNTSTPTNPNAAGLGRQAELPPPIGTRPASNGNTHTPASVDAAAARMNPAALAYNAEYMQFLTDNQLRSPTAAASFANGSRNNPFQTRVNKGEQASSYLSGQQEPKHQYADEMSRER